MPPFPRPDAHGLTDRGRERRENGDHFLIARLSRAVVVDQTSLELADSTRLTSGRQGDLFLVADGLGDTPAAERASALAVDGLLRYALNTMPWFFRLEDYEEDLEDELKRAMEKCQARIEAEVEENPSRKGMGTALAAAFVLWPRLFVVQVGSPRGYLFRGGRLMRLTAAEGDPEPFSRALFSVIGGELHPAVRRATLELGDTLLLATDGLSRHVPEEKVAEILGRPTSARVACGSLVEAVNQGGGTDNTSVVVARFRRPDETPVPAPVLKAEAQGPLDPA
jgi:protein phosphatase